MLELSAHHGDKDFLVYEDERITFAEHFRAVAALAHALVDRFGITKGDRVAIAMRNLPEWVIAFWASISVGAVVVPLNAWWTGPELAYGLSDSGIPSLFVDEERQRADPPPPRRGSRTCGPWSCAARSTTRTGAGGPPSDPPSERPGSLPLPVIPLAELTGPGTGDATLPDVAIEPDDDATIFYTSGTTGRPKGAVGHPPQQRAPT